MRKVARVADVDERLSRRWPVRGYERQVEEGRRNRPKPGDPMNISARVLVTVIVFRVCDSRFPFLWTAGGASWQRPARWHGVGEGPVQYLTDTPSGAWAELLRHDEITDPADLAGISTRLWAVSIGDVEMHEPKLTLAAVTSKPDGYEVCRAEARRPHRQKKIAGLMCIPSR
jgi:RES domain-containing protein